MKMKEEKRNRKRVEDNGEEKEILDLINTKRDFVGKGKTSAEAVRNAIKVSFWKEKSRFQVLLLTPQAMLETETTLLA